MRQAFTLLYSKVVLGALLAIAIIALVLSRLRRRLRVSPDQRVHAPILWLVNVTADARLHRRLRRSARRARQVARGGDWHRDQRRATASQQLALDLDAEIVQLAERLVATRSLDHDAQSRAVAAIRADADRIDALVERTAVLIEREAAHPAAVTPSDAIGAITERLGRLEAAADAAAAGVIDTAAVTATRAVPAAGTAALDSPS